MSQLDASKILVLSAPHWNQWVKAEGKSSCPEITSLL